jgi:hypothetical protein
MGKTLLPEFPRHLSSDSFRDMKQLWEPELQLGIERNDVAFFLEVLGLVDKSRTGKSENRLPDVEALDLRRLSRAI